MHCDFCHRETFNPCRDAKDMSRSSIDGDKDCGFALMQLAKEHWDKLQQKEGKR